MMSLLCRSWLLLMLLLQLLFPTIAAEQCTLRMAAETDFPPHLIQRDGQWGGLSVELLQRLASEVNCQLSFINSPWLRSLQQSESGELDVLSHLSVSPQRKEHFAFIGPHHIEAIYLIGDPAVLPALNNLQQLTQDKDLGSIASLHGAYYGEEFSKLSQHPALARQLVSISSIQDKLALLRAGRVNAILEDLSVLHYWQQHSYPMAEKYQPLLLVYESPVYFGLSKTALSEQQIQQLTAAWHKLYHNGELAAIYRKYQLDPARLLPDALVD
ncbi:ABC transporter substrate-binding protein [Rheinheimera sp.]|uniref:substrate-binding periplasmic protein n=1 Tax=Rheinheimera sp. TaxID=1869214 RepID=UPI0027356395|nr:transporter substrate-binding domain-containing protein [Rheinheimera sp.]MDP2715118.1 transporter substrate-binding domain-containing protein [Rheinheimera sp.]